jgi:hypothetical protein
VTGLTITVVKTGNKLNLTWTPITGVPDLTTYRVYRSTTSGFTPDASTRLANVIAADGDGIPAYQQATRAFLSVMREGRVSVNNLFFEYLDLERNKDKEHKKNLVILLGHKYGKEKIDLIVTVHAPA